MNHSGLNEHSERSRLTSWVQPPQPHRPSDTHLNVRARGSILQSTPMYFPIFVPCWHFPRRFAFASTQPAPENAEFCLEMFGFRFDKTLMISAERSIAFGSNNREKKKNKRQKAVFHLDRDRADTQPGTQHKWKAKQAAHLPCYPVTSITVKRGKLLLLSSSSCLPG